MPTEQQPSKSSGPSGTDASAPATDGNPLLKLLVELGPLLVFFFTNSRAGIYWGTGAFMIATVVSLLASRLLFGRIPLMPMVSGVFILFFGALTLWFNDETFIKLKPTIVNTLFAIILFVGLRFGISFLKYVFGDAFHLHEDGWRKLTIRWAAFFIFLAVLNEVVWRSFSTDFWIGFKAWAVIPITMIFAISQLGLIKRYSLDNTPPTQHPET